MHTENREFPPNHSLKTLSLDTKNQSLRENSFSPSPSRNNPQITIIPYGWTRMDV